MIREEFIHASTLLTSIQLFLNEKLLPPTAIAIERQQVLKKVKRNAAEFSIPKASMNFYELLRVSMIQARI